MWRKESPSHFTDGKTEAQREDLGSLKSGCAFHTFIFQGWRSQIFLCRFFNLYSLKEFCRGRWQEAPEGRPVLCGPLGWGGDHADLCDCPVPLPTPSWCNITGKERSPLPSSDAIVISSAQKFELLTFQRRREGGDKTRKRRREKGTEGTDKKWWWEVGDSQR